MRLLIAVKVALALLPLVAAQTCYEDISTPQLVSTTAYIRRNTLCSHTCVFSFSKNIDTSYYTIDSCSLKYNTAWKPICCEGYKKNSLGTCEPICVGCTNGRCTAPNRCSCNRGYQNQQGVCVPLCDPECGHGTCTDPGQCSCHEGYVMDPKEGCVPVCDPPCLNGECTGLNTCKCFSGFQQTSKSYECAPVCDLDVADCGNGTCIASNRCQCEEGFIFENHRCIPHCERSCINGECTNPNTCTCKAGYEMNPSNSAECIPACNGGCQNGSCVAPNTCECLNGFEQSNDDPNSCEPSCDPTFVDVRKGQCIAPNVVQCNTGFMLAYSAISGRTFCTRAMDLEWGRNSTRR